MTAYHPKSLCRDTLKIARRASGGTLFFFVFFLFIFSTRIDYLLVFDIGGARLLHPAPPWAAVGRRPHRLAWRAPPTHPQPAARLDYNRKN